jgi:hypothetical protein
MTREEYFQFHEAMTKKMMEITRAKNADYTGATGDDPFANFNRVGSLGVCTTEQGFMVRMLDKYMRINSFVQKGFLHVKDESVEDTLLDLANYCLLFMGYLESKKNTESAVCYYKAATELSLKDLSLTSLGIGTCDF